MKSINPRLLYPSAVFSVVISGLLLSFNYYLLNEKQLSIKQIQQIWLWIFIIAFGFALIIYLLNLFFGNLQGWEPLGIAYFLLSNLFATHFWIKKQYQFYVRHHKKDI